MTEKGPPGSGPTKSAAAIAGVRNGRRRHARCAITDSNKNSSADYDAAPKLESIEASVLTINSADDERNPPESGLEEAALKRVKNGKLYLIPASDETRGHLTTGMAKFYSQQLQQLLQMASQRPMLE